MRLYTHIFKTTKYYLYVSLYIFDIILYTTIRML
jgi:hypothetical protein